MQIIISLQKVPLSDLKFMLFYLKIKDDDGAATTNAVPIHFSKYQEPNNQTASTE